MIKSYFSSELVYESVSRYILFNLHANGYRGNLSFHYSSLNDFNYVKYAKIFLGEQFVSVKTVASNCAAVFIDDVKMDEFLFNALFSGLRFTIAISPINLFNKSFRLSNDLYIYNLIPYIREYICEKDNLYITSEEFKNRIKTVKINKPIIYTKSNKFYDMSEIFNDYWFIYRFKGYTKMRKIKNGFFITLNWGNYYLNFKNYKKDYDFLAYRTGNNLAVMVSND